MRRGDLVVTPWGAWLEGRRFPCVLGRSGLTSDKREGDGATPLGILHVTGLLYRPDRMAKASVPTWARPIGLRDLWSDDPGDPAYNRPVRAPHRFGHERLRRADPLYDLVLLTDWNAKPPVAGLGSAIFVHSWRRPHFRTAGCVAFDPDDLAWIATRLPPGSRVIIRG